MTTQTIDISTMPAVRSYLNALLETHSEIIIMNGSTAVAKIIPLTDGLVSKRDRVPDLYPTLWVSDDFDDLLPGEYWLTEQS